MGRISSSWISTRAPSVLFTPCPAATTRLTPTPTTCSSAARCARLLCSLNACMLVCGLFARARAVAFLCPLVTCVGVCAALCMPSFGVRLAVVCLPQEICSGAQREHDPVRLRQRMGDLGIDAAPLEAYISGFEHGVSTARQRSPGDRRARDEASSLHVAAAVAIVAAAVVIVVALWSCFRP